MKYKDTRAIKVIEMVEKDESWWSRNDLPLTPNMWTEKMKAEGKRNFDNAVEKEVKKIEAKKIKQIKRLLLKGYSIEKIEKIIYK